MLEPSDSARATSQDETKPPEKPAADLVCFSHLRWDFVFQRPQHLMTRFSRAGRVFFVQEPIFDASNPRLHISRRQPNLWVIQPHLAVGSSPQESEQAQQWLVNELLNDYQIREYVGWYYTPMALGFTAHLQPSVVVYDCMDELVAFRGAPSVLVERERELFRRAHLVFTGGQSLYQAKIRQHPKVYAFPSSVDKAHFAQARQSIKEPADQSAIPHPRIGFYGVIDERMDMELVGGLAAAQPDWHFILVGPVAKIDAAALPQQPNLHYLEGKPYESLPQYLAGWDAAFMPFARNEATRFISPTKTPEFLAGGRPVVATWIQDVVQPYGDLGLVEIADTVPDFAAALKRVLERGQDAEWLARVDAFLSQMSWDSTWEQMARLVDGELEAHRTLSLVENGSSAVMVSLPAVEASLLAQEATINI